MNRHLRVLLAAVACLSLATAADAATLMSTASGAIGTTATWSVVDTTGTNAFLNSETANTALTTSPVASSTFTPAAETVSSIGVKLASVAAAPSGTLTIKLANSTSPGSRECTLTVNVADLVSAAAATVEGGWIILACAASPNGTDSYTVTANTSVAAMVNLFSLATTNWSRLIVTSGTQVNGPAAGDKFYVFGQLTGAGTHNAYAVTIDTTSLVNYGNVANTLIDPSIAVGQFGTLKFASAASTAYVSEFAGPMVVYNGGTFTVGTAGTPIPSTGSATLTLNSTVEGDTGINVRNGGTFNSAGSAGGRTVVKTLLDATATGASTSTLTVADSTGWLSGDSIIIAGTVATAGSDATSKWDAATLTSNASGTSLPLTGAVTNTHTSTKLSYTSTSTGIAYAMNMSPAVILLNRNVIVQGSGSTTNGYVYFQPLANGAIDWTEFSNISGTVATKRGVEVDIGPGGSFSLTNSSFINSHSSCLVLAPTNANFGGTSGSYLTIQHNVMYNCASAASGTLFGVGMITGTYNNYWKIDDLTVLRTAYTNFSATAVKTAGIDGQFTNITVSGSGNSGTGAFVMTGGYNARSVLGGQAGNVVGPINLYANVGPPWSNAGVSEGITGTIAGVNVWHETGSFILPGNGGELTIDPLYVISSAFGIYVPSAAGQSLTFRNGVVGFDTVSGSGFPLTVDAVTNNFTFDNMEICPSGSVGGVTFVACGAGPISLMHDVSSAAPCCTNPSQALVFLRNTSILNQSTKYPTQIGEEGFYGTRAAIMQDCAACSPVKHAAWIAGGFLNYDTAITHSSGYSLRMTPKVQTFSGYIVGTTLTVTSGSLAGTAVGDMLTSNGAGFIGSTYLTAGGTSSFTTSMSQTTCSSGSPCQFQSYNNAKGSLLRLQSAPFGRGMKVAVASGQTANVCAWIRPSISTDAAPPWGGSAVTYNGDNPRMIVRANPYMGVQTDTVIGTSSPTAGSWSQFCASPPTAPADGEFEIVLDADQTFTSNAGGSVNLAEWSCTSCGGANGSQFWWNGAPGDAIAPAAAGGLLVNPGMHGGLN